MSSLVCNLVTMTANKLELGNSSFLAPTTKLQFSPMIYNVWDKDQNHGITIGVLRFMQTSVLSV